MLESIELDKAIVKHGTAAVLRYRHISGILHDNQLPEIFLGGFIACGIHDELNVHAHVERFYPTIAMDRGLELSADLRTIFGGQKADVAVYQNGMPVAIVELKKFGDYRTPAGIIADRDKMSKLSRLCGVDAYLGVLITDVVSGIKCQERARMLGEALGQELDVIGEPQPSLDSRWSWCFASVKISQVCA